MKKKLLFLVVFFVILLTLLFLLKIPFIKDNSEINALNKEISMVDKYVSTGEGNIEDIRNFINKNVTSENYNSLEESLEKYLITIINNSDELYKIVYSKNYQNIMIVTKENLVSNLKYIINIRRNISDVKLNLLNIDVHDFIKRNSQDQIDMYYRLLENKIDINKLIDKIDDFISELDKDYEIIKYLTDNNDYWNIDGEIVFNKRSVYDEFEKIINELNVDIDFQLVDDKIEPEIIVDNIVIYQGDYININDKIKCYDEVDGELDCNITGNYDLNKAGVYSIDVLAIDKSNNSSKKTVNLIVKEPDVYTLPYYIEVIRNQETVIVYGMDDKGDYTKIIQVFVSSPGAGYNTPVGTFKTKKGYEWGALFGNVYGQYSTVITGHILFHSVPYHSMSKDDLVWEYYNRLGTKDSLGCIRLTVADAKWIYDNCESGTMVKIYDGELPNGVTKPVAQKIDPNDPRRGWDPTDPDPNNPWHQ